MSGRHFVAALFAVGAIGLAAMDMEALVAQKVHTYLAGQEVFHDPRTNAPWAGDQPIREGFWVPALRRAKVR